MSPANSLKELLLEEIRSLYDGEAQLLKALPQMASAAIAPELKQAFDDHLEQTNGHVARLDGVFESLDAPAEGKPCQAIRGLVSECLEALDFPAAIRDAALLGTAQRIEHFEIGAYRTAINLADKIECVGAADILQETLDEEKSTSEVFFDLADPVFDGLLSIRSDDN